MRTLSISAIVLAAGLATLSIVFGEPAHSDGRRVSRCDFDSGMWSKAADWKRWGTELLLALLIVAMLLTAIWGLDAGDESKAASFGYCPYLSPSVLSRSSECPNSR
jgi:hypothetical protein